MLCEQEGALSFHRAHLQSLVLNTVIFGAQTFGQFFAKPAADIWRDSLDASRKREYIANVRKSETDDSQHVLPQEVCRRLC